MSQRGMLSKSVLEGGQPAHRSWVVSHRGSACLSWRSAGGFSDSQGLKEGLSLTFVPVRLCLAQRQTQCRLNKSGRNNKCVFTLRAAEPRS